MTVESKKKIKCNECGWSWKLSEGGDDPYTCHKCGYLNKPNNMKKIIKLTESELLSLIERLINENNTKLRTGKKPKKETQEMKEGELTEKCWPGYTQKGMKTMFGKRYPNCVKKTVKDLDEGEINWKKEKSWKIQDQFPIEVFVEKSWTGKYYVVKVPIMSMSYETFMDLDNFGKVDISTYDYENGEAKFTSYSLDNIKKWGENNKDKIHINYSRLMNEQISRIQSMMGLNEQGELDTLPKKYNPESILDFSNSKVKDIVWRAGNMELNPLNGGIWFGETKKGVENFAISVRGKVIEGKPYHINLENPFYFDSFWHGYVEEVKNSPNGRKTLMDKLKLEGYDGIIIDTDTWNDTGDEYAVTSKQYIVFYPENIKPA